MKLASLSAISAETGSGSRDGRLMVVSDDLAWCADAGHIVATMQGALDDWTRYEPALAALATDLEHGSIPRERFHEREALAPLPRAYLWANGRDEVCAGDTLQGARSAIGCGGECLPAPGLCVVTGEVAKGASADAALGAVRLVGLINDVSAAGLCPGQATAFSPVLVTPDALGAAWELPLALHVERGGQTVSTAPGASPCSLGEAIAQLARTRSIGAGSVFGASTPWTEPLRAGETVRIEVRDAKGHSVFGAIEQQLA
ncbi:MAG: fumarylacetoacetate hydrolase family protein [Novosphingobium sp.]